MTRVQQAEAWLREYLKDGPRGIPNSYWNHGAPRYEGSSLPPQGIGPKTIDIAMKNLGVVDTCTGPRGGRRWQLPESAPNAIDTHADREALAEKVASAFQSAFSKLEEHKADIEKLWKEFECLRSGETIMGCKTKTEFCQKVLGRSIRAVQYLLSGGNPVSKRATRETVSRPTSPVKVDAAKCSTGAEQLLSRIKEWDKQARKQEDSLRCQYLKEAAYYFRKGIVDIFAHTAPTKVLEARFKNPQRYRDDLKQIVALLDGEIEMLHEIRNTLAPPEVELTLDVKRTDTPNEPSCAQNTESSEYAASVAAGT
jgi:hypothetical protein